MSIFSCSPSLKQTLTSDDALLGPKLLPLPGGDLVSRESQKTREFGMEGGVLLGVRVSNNLIDKINFRCFQE